jgi:hypothetical protein
MKRIPLTQGKIALVDDEYLEDLSKHEWQFDKGCRTGYAVRTIYRPKKELIRMHRYLLGLRKGDKMICDHIDGNGLNNQKHNLRLCNKSENGRNRNKTNNIKLSIFKGVTFNKSHGKWQPQICLNGKHQYLGYFSSEVEAARAYDKKAKEIFGEFAFLNFDKPAKLLSAV